LPAAALTLTDEMYRLLKRFCAPKVTSTPDPFHIALETTRTLKVA
jgi:hypothetical protein